MKAKAMSDVKDEATYQLTNEFRFEDLVAALDRAGSPSRAEIEKWRAEEAKRQSGLKRRWFSKVRAA